MRSIILVFLSLLSLLVHAQSLTLSPSRLQFGNRTTGSAYTLTVTVTANTQPLEIQRIRSTHSVFSVKDTQCILSSGQSITLSVVFRPKHNIIHFGYIVVDLAGANNNQTLQVTGTGVYGDTYYAGTQNLSEEALKAALKTIITTGQRSCTYDNARNQMFMTIDNKKENGQGASTNTLECVYTGRTAIDYTSRTDAQNRFNFNTEHTWPQSLFNSSQPMVCDLHHLFPTDETANGKRSNFPFAMVPSPVWTDGGSKFGGSTFEPRDVHKGAVARAMMYFVLRYENYQGFFTNQENVLRSWHMQFQPTLQDQNRNNDIFSAQNNRNPFVDHPEFTERITSLSDPSVTPFRRSLWYDSSMIALQSGGSVDTTLTGTTTVINTGNAAANYQIRSAQNKITIRTPNGSLAADSQLVVQFGFKAFQDGSTTVLYDTLIISSNAANARVMRIPVQYELVYLTASPEVVASPETFYTYPNPLNAEWNISSQNGVCFDVTLTNLQGMILHQSEACGKHTIATQSFAPGVYIATIRTGSLIQHQRISIQH